MKSWIKSLAFKLNQAHMRACVLLEGEENWQQDFCQSYLNLIPTASGFWVGKNSPFEQAKNLTPKQTLHQLGQETDFVIFSASQGIEPNTLGILSGMIKAGGLCIICLPNKKDWLKQPNIASQKYLSYPFELKDSLKGFNAFFWQKLSQHAIHIQQRQTVAELSHWLEHPELCYQAPKTALPTQDQISAIKQIHRVAFGHRKRPLLIHADRGRGKSTLLGIAAIELIQQGKQKITFSSARKDMVQIALNKIAQQGLSHAVEFRAPDDLIANLKPSDILMIDEASHLPLPLLQAILQSYHRVVFASTQQGYEGSGRGFSLKFSHLLNSLTPGWKLCELQTPIRWQKNDWLEKTINKTLLLSQPKYYVPKHTFPLQKNTDNISYHRINIDQLLQSPKKIEQLFQLLVNAHYQTSPNDLMQLLDTPNLVILTANLDDKIIGALIAVPEGKLPDFSSETTPRRFQGHLFPQVLYKQSHNPKWLELQGLRIMRIAVAESWQNQTIGSNLLQKIVAYANQMNLDYLSSSFGAIPSIIKFWSKNSYSICGLGLKRDKASGLHSVMLSQAISIEAQSLITQTQQEFTQQFSFSLLSEFNKLEADTIIAIISQLPLKATDFPTGYLDNQPYENLSLPLRNWLLSHPQFLAQQTDTHLKNMLCQKIIQNSSWKELRYSTKIPSRKLLEKQLKQAFYLFILKNKIHKKQVK